jgi:hypothetical protein
MKRLPPLGMILGGTIIGALALPARGDLVAYDGFDYGPIGADLLSANGGVGFMGSWRAGGFNASINTNYDLTDDLLSFGPLVRTGNAVRTAAVNSIAGVMRDLTQPLGQGGTTAYVSFLIQPEGVLHAGAFNGFLGLVLESPTEPELFVGKPGAGAIDHWVLEDRGGSGQFASGVETTSTATALLVVKAEFAVAGNDTFTLYVNPTLGDPEPATGVVKSNANVGTVTGLTIYSTGAMRIDEIRLGETFADVTPIVPEPAGIVLWSVAASALIASRRRGGRSLVRCNGEPPRAGTHD